MDPSLQFFPLALAAGGKGRRDVERFLKDFYFPLGQDLFADRPGWVWWLVLMVAPGRKIGQGR